MHFSRLSFTIVAVIGFGTCVWCGYFKACKEKLEQSLAGFPRLPIEGYDRTNTSLNPRTTSGVAEDLLLPEVTGGPVVPQMQEALANRDFRRLEALLCELVRRDPQAALAAVHSLPEWARARATEVVLGAWLRLAPDAAWQFIASHDMGFFTGEEFITALGETRRFDLGITAINRLQSVSDRKTAARNLFRVWAATDLDGFAVWVKTLPTEVRGLANAEIAARYFAEGSIDANLLNSMLGLNPADANSGWHTFAERLISETGYARAKEVFSQVSQPGGGDGGAYAALAYGGPVEDAAGWLAKITDPNAQLGARIMVVNKTSLSSPAMAAQLSAAGSNQAVIDKQMMRIVPQWAIKDPDAALAFLKVTTTISPDVRGRLIDTVNSLVPPHNE